jgi:hypothetical protein
MQKHLIPSLAILYFVAMAIFLTYPGYVPFDRIRPFVLGMPFSMFWQVLWICGAGFVLAGLFLWEKKRRGSETGARPSSPDAGDQ